MTSQWRHHNKTHSCYSELNSLQNVYFWFLIFGKLTKWCCFVTYLSNDPHTMCSGQHSLLPYSGWEMSTGSILRAMGWRPDWGSGMSACGSSCLLTWAMDGHIVCCGIISSCQSPATSDIVRHFYPQVRLMLEEL